MSAERFWNWRDRHSMALGVFCVIMIVAWAVIVTSALSGIGEDRRREAKQKCRAEFRLARTASDTLNVLIHTNCEAPL
jgi:hypothetical protein